MKGWITVIAFLLMAAPGIGQNTLPQNLDSVSIFKEDLKEWINALAHDSMQGRPAGSEAGAKAAGYISSEFEKLKLLPATDSGYAISFPFALNGNSLTGHNVVGVIPGKTDTMIIFSAHFDHIGTRMYQEMLAQMPGNSADTIFNGANDNASGMATILALAKFFRHMPSPYYTLAFAAFDAEEAGLFGSKFMAEAIDPGMVKLVFNFEMMGRSKRPEEKTIYLLAANKEYSKNGLRNSLHEHLGITNRRAFIFRNHPNWDSNLFKRSDNYSFYLRKIRAVTFMMIGDEDEFYHHPADQSEFIDFDLMEKSVRIIASAIQPFTMPVTAISQLQYSIK